MPTAALMIQATNSNAGKSVLVAGLCRLFASQGLAVQPFKPQNMSNNAAAVSGGEIGRAQALQAMAAGVEPSVHHNPVLLKPQSDKTSQVVVKGRAVGQLEATRFVADRHELMTKVLDSFKIISADADIVVVEGAGSPAETNLRAGDIANMGFARAAGVPVVLAGDIDRGGVIASLVGTSVVLSDADRRHVKGYLINKFRGDVPLFDAGLTDITERTRWPSLGVVTWCPDLARLPAEDAVELEQRDRTSGTSSVRIVVPMLSRISNFDDLDPLALEPTVEVEMVPPGRPLPVADLIIIPGTKATVADLALLRSQGWDVDIAAHVRRGGRVLGLCGGYQILGRSVEDPGGVEGPPGLAEGLGLLDMTTVLEEDKITRPVTGTHRASGVSVSGYEIHAGRSTGPATKRPWLTIEGRPEGAVSEDGKIAGSHVHGLFTDDRFRATILNDFGVVSTEFYDRSVEDALDVWAEQLDRELDLPSMLEMARSRC